MFSYFGLFSGLLVSGAILYRFLANHQSRLTLQASILVRRLQRLIEPSDTAIKVGNRREPWLKISYVYEGRTYVTLVPFSRIPLQTTIQGASGKVYPFHPSVVPSISAELLEEQAFLRGGEWVTTL